MSITKQIADYIRSGENNNHTLGVEVEHFVLDRQNHPISFEKLSDLIRAIGKEHHWRLDIVDGHPIGLKADHYAISLEPACQLEISIDPFETIDEIRDTYRQFTRLWGKRLNLLGYRLITRGQHPDVESGHTDPDAFRLIPKRRYEYMDQNFRSLRRYGKYMMRASASTQISIDFSSEQDMKEKLALATLLSPILALAMENSTAEHLFGSDRKHLLRIQEWLDLDPDRTGFIPGSLDADFGYKSYAEALYHRPLLTLTYHGRTENASTHSLFDYTDPSGNAFQKAFLSEKNTVEEGLIEHTISMFFFHIRIKKFIEIRIADSVPEQKMLWFAALIKGIFYHRKNMDILAWELKDITDVTQVEDVFSSIIRDGENAIIYNQRTAGEWIDHITALAALGLNGAEQRYLLSASDDSRKIYPA